MSQPLGLLYTRGWFLLGCSSWKSVWTIARGGKWEKSYLYVDVGILKNSRMQIPLAPRFPPGTNLVGLKWSAMKQGRPKEISWYVKGGNRPSRNKSGFGSMRGINSARSEKAGNSLLTAWCLNNFIELMLQMKLKRWLRDKQGQEICWDVNISHSKIIP